MTTQLDCSITIGGPESVYGTAVTPTRAYEFLTESFGWQPTFVQGQGLRVGSRVDRSSRRGLGMQTAGGDLELECVSKGMGFLWNAALGASTSNLISGSAYQQVHTVATTDYLPFYTIQKGVPLLGGGAAQPQTYHSCSCSGFTLTASTGGIVSLKTSWLAQNVDTSTAYTAPSYAATPQLFTFTGGSLVVGGTLTLPTTTALATVAGSPISGGTAVANVRDFNLTWDNKLDGGGFTFGNNGQRYRSPAVGKASGTGTFTAEFNTAALQAAYMNQSDLAMVLTFQAPTAIAGSIYPTLQVVIPEVRLEGELAKANGGDVVTQSIGFTVLDALSAASPLYVVSVTTDTAI